jgi:hypothetical protein
LTNVKDDQVCGSIGKAFFWTPWPFLIKMNSRKPSRLSITSLDSGDDKLYQEKLMKDQKKVGHGAGRGNHGKHFPDPTKETWDGNPTPVVAVTANWCSCGWP